MADEPNLNPEPAPNPADASNQPQPGAASQSQPQPQAAAPEPAQPQQPLPAAAPVSAQEAHATQTGGWPGAFAAIGMIFDQIKKNPQPLVVMLGVWALVSLLSYLVGPSGAANSESTSTMFASKDAGYQNILNLIFLVAIPTYALALADKRKITGSEFMKTTAGQWFSVLIALILVGFIIGFSIIPGVIFWIWTAAWFAFPKYLIVDRKLGAFEALNESKVLAQKHKAKVWGVMLAPLLIALPGYFLIFLGVPVLGDVIVATASIIGAGALALLYRYLQQQSSQQPAAAAAPASPAPATPAPDAPQDSEGPAPQAPTQVQ